MVIDNVVCSQVPSWTSEPVNVEAAEPGENLNLNRGGKTLAVESHDQKADLRARQDHKTEEKTEAEKESDHHAVWSLKPDHPPPASQQLPLWTGVCKKVGLNEVKHGPKKENCPKIIQEPSWTTAFLHVE